MVDSEPDIVEKDAPKEDSSKEKLRQHHISKILDEVLEATPASVQKYRHPIIVDVVLAIGLLIAMGGFSTGLFRMYIAHSAEQSITKGNFKAAIAILEGAPFPNVFASPGTEPRELLDRALYLDATEKLNAYSEDPAGLKELEKIEPGSEFFELSQQILKEHFKPSTITLEGGASQEEHISQQETADRNTQSEQSANP